LYLLANKSLSRLSIFSAYLPQGHFAGADREQSLDLLAWNPGNDADFLERI